MVLAGLQKLTLLNVLKNSARNSIACLSLILVVLCRPMSKFLNPGPVIVLRPTFPKQKGGVESPKTFVSLQVANALTLNHSVVVFGPAFGFCPGTRMGCCETARAPRLAASTLPPIVMLYGKPLWMETIESRSQPSNTFPTGPCVFRYRRPGPKGNW